MCCNVRSGEGKLNLNRLHEAWIGSLSFSVTPILTYIHRGIGDLTVHGADHCREVERIGIDVLQKCNRMERKCNTSSYEDYLVVASAWLHDLGNIYGRLKHNENSCKIIDKIGKEYLWGLVPNAVDLVKWICYTHLSSVDINGVDEFVDVEGGVKLRYLAALFRLLDASDMANRRAPAPVYVLLKDSFEDADADKHWTSHQAIMDVSFPEDSELIVITVIDKDKAQLAVENFKKDFDSVKHVLAHYDFPWSDFRIKLIEKVPVDDEGGIS
jgi:hypothetical protein